MFGLFLLALNVMKHPGAAFFLYAHPDFTYRHDFIDILGPILKAQISGRELEFDIQPENLKITSGLNRFSEKVVMIRSTPGHSEAVQRILTQLCSDGDETDIQALRKYVFAPMNITGDTDKSTQLGLLRTQHNFRRSVYHYIVTNVSNMTTQFPVIFAENTENTDSSPQPESESGEDAHMSDTTTDHNQNDNSSSANEQASGSDPTPEPYSLREWLYDLTDDNNEALIHAAYPSTNDAKIFVLCARAKAVQVLHLLHNMVDIASQVFPEEAMVSYFGPNKELPLVHNHPRASSELSSYATKLAAYATASNPQEEHTSSQPSDPTQRGPKRNRDGEIRGAPISYAAAATSTQPIATYGADVNGLMKQLSDNLKNLQHLEEKQKSHGTTFNNIELRFQQVEGGLQGHGKVLETISSTQTQQGKMLTTLSSKITNLTSRLSGTPVSQDDSNVDEHPPNPLHGEPGGMEK